MRFQGTAGLEILEAASETVAFLWDTALCPEFWHFLNQPQDGVIKFLQPS